MSIMSKDYKDIFKYFRNTYKTVSILSEKINFKSFLKIEIEDEIHITISEENGYYLANILFMSKPNDILIFSFYTSNEFITKFKLHLEWEFFADEYY